MLELKKVTEIPARVSTDIRCISNGRVWRGAGDPGYRRDYWHAVGDSLRAVNGLGIESRWRLDFPHPSTPALGPT